MAKMTIYVPDEVAQTMERHKKSINVSEVCQRALMGEIEKRTRLLIISQNARLSSLVIPPHAVLRVNVAWIKSKEQLDSVLENAENDVFLDFPEGRKKPPLPVLKLPDLLAAMRRHRRVRYFGATDVRDARTVKRLLGLIPPSVQLIPKIESRAGVDALEEIAEALPYATKYIMLDKEDLYTDMSNDNASFLDYLQRVREQCSRCGVHPLELAGVIFLSDVIRLPLAAAELSAPARPRRSGSTKGARRSAR